ncbi:MAG: NAD+ synthase [Gammaproteobacteria bacterium]|nr:NAD+ synthase [Gammaproteobacteria bacterium]
MARNVRIALAQLNLLVGDVNGNVRMILDWTSRAVEQFQADLIVFPELALTSYPPEDLLKRSDFMAACEAGLERLKRDLPRGIAVIVGLPEWEEGRRYNSAFVLRDGGILARYRKQHLPNYGVFDELRYFTPGAEPCVFPLERGEGEPLSFGLTICEDIWHPEPIAQAKAAGAQLMLNLNASPYQHDKPSLREQTLRARAAETGLPIVYVNLIGGQDELVFDGGSLVMDAKGCIIHRLPMFEEALGCVEILPLQGEDQGEDKSPSPLKAAGWGEGERRLPKTQNITIHPIDGLNIAPLDETAAVYRALVLAIRDYAHKNGFKGALLGLSGGIDSALTLALAVDALGADQVEAVMMPSRYTADISQLDAAAEAEALGVAYHVVPIEPAFTAFQQLLAPVLHGRPSGTTDENLQARSRGVVLMGLSNATGKLLLTTGNKSEMAVGYATLYGDMAGGFAPLKDVPKMLVFRLARYRNTLAPVIPERVITRPPSAELRPDQKDEDSLPPYPVLDAILEAYIERMEGISEIVARGFDEATVRRVIRMVDLAEYKRRQAPPGVKITSRAFGRERRFPITNGFRR